MKHDISFGRKLYSKSITTSSNSKADIDSLCNAYINSNTKIQALDYTSLAVVVSELYGIIVPSKVENVIQDGDDSIYISLRTSTNNNYWLQLCWDNMYSRICIGQPPAQTDSASLTSYSFGTILRTLLRDLYLTDVHISEPFERIIALTFADKINVESNVKYKLILEVMSARSNVILVTSDNIIQACAYQVPLSKSIRSLQTSNPYYPPPLGGGLYYPTDCLPTASSTLEFDSFVKKLKDQNSSIVKSLVSTYKGISPNLANIIIHRVSSMSNAPLSYDTNVNSLTKEQYTLLFDIFIAWVLFITNKTSSAVGPIKVIAQPLIHKINERHEFNLVDFVLTDSVSPQSTTASLASSPFNFFINSIFSKYQNQKQFALRKSRCERKLENLVKKYDSLKDMHEMQLKEASGEKVDQLQMNGDLITAYLYAWKENEPKIVCQDFDTGDNIVFPLEPGQTPVSLAASFFKKSKKLRRSINIITNIIDQINVNLEYLNELDGSLSLLEKYISYHDFIALADIEVEIDQIRQLINDDMNTANANSAKANTNSNAKTKKASSGGKKKIQSPQKVNANTNSKKVSKALQGLLIVKPPISDDAKPPIYVGRSAKQNDRITFEIAKEHHIWLHVQGCPGAHCLLALEPGQEAESSTIQYAADIAAFYSKARGSTNVPVTYCNPKYLKRMKGAAPGMVSILQQLGVVYGNPDRGRTWSEMQ